MVDALPIRFPLWWLAALLALASAPAIAVVHPLWSVPPPVSPLVNDSPTALAGLAGGVLVGTTDVDLDRFGNGRARLVALDGNGALRWSAVPGPGRQLAILDAQPCGSGALFLAGGMDRGPIMRVAGALAADGRVIWRREIGPGDFGPTPGTYAIAANEDCSMVVVRAEGSSSVGADLAGRSVHLSLLSAAGGEPRWSIRLRGVPVLAGHAFAPVITAGHGGAYILARRLADGDGVVVRIDAALGEVDWISEPFDLAADFPAGSALALRAGTVEVAGWSTQSVSGGARQARVVSLEATDGALRWSRSLTTEVAPSSNAISLRSGAGVTLRFGDDIARLTPSDGSVIWRRARPRIAALAVGADGTVAVASTPVAGSPEVVEQLETADGTTRWSRASDQLAGRAVRLAVADDTGNVALLAYGDELRGLDDVMFADELLLLARDDGAILRRGPLPAPMQESALGVVAVSPDAVVVWSPEFAADGSGTLVVEKRAIPGGTVAWQTRVPIALPTDSVRPGFSGVAMDGLVALAVSIGPATAHRASSQLVVLDADDGTLVFQDVRAATFDGMTWTGWNVAPIALRPGDGVTVVEQSVEYSQATSASRGVVRHRRFAGGGWTDPAAGPGVAFAHATAAGILVTEFDSGPGLPIRLLRGADGHLLWERVVPDGRDWLSDVTAGDIDVVLWGERFAASPAGLDSRAVFAAFALADGAPRWQVEHDSPTTIPDAPTSVRRLGDGDLLVSVDHRDRLPGQSVWRLGAADGSVAWRRALPASQGFGRSGGDLFGLPDGRVAVPAQVRGGGQAFSPRVEASYLVAIDPIDGATSGWHAVSGAQPFGGGPDRQSLRWIDGAAVPIALARDWSAGGASSGKLLAVDVPSLATGDLSLHVIDVRRDQPGSGRLDVELEARYAGTQAVADSILRVAAPAGAALVSLECTATPPSVCGDSGIQPQGRQALALASGANARVTFAIQALGWPSDCDAVHVVLEGDHRIADDDATDVTAVLPFAGVPLRDSFE